MRGQEKINHLRAENNRLMREAVEWKRNESLITKIVKDLEKRVAKLQEGFDLQERAEVGFENALIEIKKQDDEIHQLILKIKQAEGHIEALTNHILQLVETYPEMASLTGELLAIFSELKIYPKQLQNNRTSKRNIRNPKEIRAIFKEKERGNG